MRLFLSTHRNNFVRIWEGLYLVLIMGLWYGAFFFSLLPTLQWTWSSFYSVLKLALMLMKVKVTQSCSTVCNPIDYTVRGIL